ncbi:hypothetical protein J6590_015944 [Homalodisca vitripennis]|nr:hypothetical protein J6590_015944 [Homalodisca vitripennis]
MVTIPGCFEEAENGCLEILRTPDSRFLVTMNSLKGLSNIIILIGLDNIGEHQLEYVPSQLSIVKQMRGLARQRSHCCKVSPIISPISSSIGFSDAWEAEINTSTYPYAQPQTQTSSRYFHLSPIYSPFHDAPISAPYTAQSMILLFTQHPPTPPPQTPPTLSPIYIPVHDTPTSAPYTAHSVILPPQPHIHPSP